jgi:hypothetical protein
VTPTAARPVPRFMRRAIDACFEARILWDSYAPHIRIYEGTADRLPVQMVYLEVSP